MGVVATGDGLRAYYKGKIEELEVHLRDKQHNLRRMEAQRNELNNKGRKHSDVCRLHLVFLNERRGLVVGCFVMQFDDTGTSRSNP